MTAKKPELLNDKDLDQVCGGLIVTIHELIISSVKDDRPKVAGTAEGWAGAGASS